MATEKRLIDADDALEQLKQAEKEMQVVTPLGCKAVDIKAVLKYLESRPTVDAVEVIRCKDCKKWFRHTEVDRERGECRRYQTTKHETGYCDRGERKDNE